MASEKLTNKPLTTSIDGTIWTQRYILGAWVDYRINISDLQSAVNTRTADVMLRTQYTNETASFTHPFSADDKLEALDFRLNSGSCTIAVGTTPAGTEIIPTIALTTGGDDNFNYKKSFQSTTTMYITITGTADINIDVWFRSGVL